MFILYLVSLKKISSLTADLSEAKTYTKIKTDDFTDYEYLTFTKNVDESKSFRFTVEV